MIIIDSNSSLNLRIDPTKQNAGKIIGHALYGSNGNLFVIGNPVEGIEYDTGGGALNIITNGLGVGGVIAMSDDNGNQMKVDGYVRTDSIIHSATLNDNEDIKITVKRDLDEVISGPVDPVDPVDPDPVTPKPKVAIKYPKLDLIYKSIISSDLNINALNPTVAGIELNETLDDVRTIDESVPSRAIRAVKTAEVGKEELLNILNDIFVENPYGYASYTSKESIDIFSNLVLNNSIKPNAGRWMTYGGATYDNSRCTATTDNTFADKDIDNDIYGGYALGEYGISNNSSVGVILGGTNSDTDISNASKLEGNSFYVGTYGRTEINNFKLKAGIGYQYTDYDTTRVAANTYQYGKYENSMITNGFSCYTSATYSFNLGKNYFLEPKFNLTYTRISQNSVNEGKEALAIEVDSKTIDYLDTEIGIDLAKELKLNKGSMKFKLGASYLYALDGADKDYLTGRMDGGSDFDILIPKRDKDMAKIGVSFEGEQENGFIYNIGGGYITGSDLDEYYVGTGIGFKF